MGGPRRGGEGLGDAAHDVVAAASRTDPQPGQVGEVFDRSDGGRGVGGDEDPGFVYEGHVRVSARSQARVLVSFDDEDVVAAGAQGGHAGGFLGFLDAQVDAGKSLRQIR